MSAALEVRCVEGCGDATLAIASIVIAAVSVGVALVALYTSRRILKMGRAEHEVFMDQLGARADFGLELSVISHDIADGVLETPAEVIGIRLQLGIANTGNKAASHVGVNLLVPTKGAQLRWTTQHGGDLPDPDKTAGPLSTAEELVAEDGSRQAAHYLVRTYETQGLKDHRVAFAKFSVTMPKETGSELVMPIKLKVWSDDLPDGVDDRVEQIEFRLRRVKR